MTVRNTLPGGWKRREVHGREPRVLFVLAPLGGGHATVVRALSQACQALAGPGVEVNTLDVFSRRCSRFPLTAIPWLYRFFTTAQPWLWRTLYHLTDSAIGFALVEWLAQPFLQSGLRRSLASWQPDIVVSVFPALGRSISRALAAIGSTVPMMTVVIDLVTVHPAWICDASAAYIVATPEAADACAIAGIPRERIHCYGLPVPDEFMQSCSDHAEVRRRLGLDAHAPTVLLMGGGEGSGHLEPMVDALANTCREAQLVIMTGRNDALRRHLISRSFAVPCTILGYTDNVSEWMRASDLLITKAGPATVMEALHSGLPLILTDSLPQEAGTVRYLVEHGAARAASAASDVVATVSELLSRVDLVEALRYNGEALHQEYAAHDTAALILEMVRDAAQAANAARSR